MPSAGGTRTTTDETKSWRSGTYAASEDPGVKNIAKATIFTCLSHDIIAHETTHALVDGLRASFLIPTGPDVLAFHEAIGDLVAIFLHFQYPTVVRTVLQCARGDLRQPTMLIDLAQQFGQTTGAGRALRVRARRVAARRRLAYDGAIGVMPSAAFSWRPCTTRSSPSTPEDGADMRLATGGTGWCRMGHLHGISSTSWRTRRASSQSNS